MKTYFNIMPILLLALQSLLLVLKLIALLFGWQLTVVNGLVFALPMALAALVKAAICISGKGIETDSSLELVCLSVALPLSLLNFLMLPFMQSVAMFLIVVVNCVGCLVAYLCCKGAKGLRIFTGIAAIVLTVAIVGSVFLNILFHNFGVTEVVRSEPSPGGTYTANVLNIDQGALGGDSAVRVQRVSLWGIPLDDVVVLDRRVWLGDWGTTHLIGMRWVDDDTLMIEGKEHDFH